MPGYTSLGTPSSRWPSCWRPRCQQPRIWLTALAQGLTELSVSGLLIYRVTDISSYRHPELPFLTVIHREAVCAPWDERTVHNDDKTARHDVQHWSGMSPMCTSPWHTLRSMLTILLKPGENTRLSHRFSHSEHLRTVLFLLTMVKQRSLPGGYSRGCWPFLRNSEISV